MAGQVEKGNETGELTDKQKQIELQKQKRIRAEEIRRIEHHLIQVPSLNGLIIDEKATEALKGYAHTLFFILGPKHIFGNDKLPADPKSAQTIKQLQDNWATGPESAPAIVLLPRGTEEFKVDWAMVSPEDFKKSPETLLESIGRANDVDNTDRVRSLGFVYTIVKGERPLGSQDPNPLAALPGKSRF